MFFTILSILVLFASTVWIEPLEPISQQIDGFCMATNSQSQVIIFGGLNPNSNAISSNLIIAQQQNNVFSKVVEARAPIARYGSCCCTHLSFFYIYGGKNEHHTMFNELWQYDINSASWSLINLNGNPTGRYGCSMTSQNNTLLVIGSSSDPANHLQIDLQTSTVRVYQLSRVISTQLTSVLWDGSLETIEMQGQHELQGAIKIYDKVTQPLTAPKMSKIQTDVFLVRSQQGLFLIKNHIITQISGDSAGCQPITITSDNYVFLICPNSLLVIAYPSMSFNQPSYSIQNWPSDMTATAVSNISDDIIVVGNIKDKLRLFQLKKNACQFSQNLQECWYGWMICRTGFKGSDCNTRLCPNGIVLYNKPTFTSLIHECSAAGNCINGICSCQRGRSGADCSIHLKEKCSGTLLSDYPLSICECNSTKVGGINCDKQFCYNDCCGKGQCVGVGWCKCPSSYTGADCSIYIIPMDFNWAYRYGLTIILVILIFN